MSEGDGDNNNGDNGAGGGDDSWRAAIPEQLRDAPFFKSATSVDGILADLNNAAGHMGNSIRIPGADATDEARNDFYKKAMEKIPGLMPVPNADDPDAMSAIYGRLGKPEKPEDYKAPDIEGVDWKDHNLGALKARAHAVGMSQGQFKDFVSSMAGENKSASELAAHELSEDLTALRGEWGAAFDGRINTIRGLMQSQENTPPEILAALNADQLPSATVRWLYDMAQSIDGEGAAAGGDNGNGSGKPTPMEAASQAAEIRNDPDYFNPASPRRPLLIKKHVELMGLANPESENGTINSLQA